MKLFAKKGRPDHQANIQQFERLMQMNNDIRFYQPQPILAPWHVQAEINGVLVNMWPHLLKGNIAGCKAVVGYEALQRLIGEARADDSDIDLLE